LAKQFGGGMLKRGHTLQALHPTDLDIGRGEVVGLVGESGSGKTTLARCALRLIEPSGGSIEFDGIAITGLPPSQMKPLRRRMQYVFQDPFSSLSPRMNVLQLLSEGLGIQGIARTAQQDRVARALAAVDLPANALYRYPHEFSGGQRQRLGIARALALEPELLVADEPVSALDVSIQAQIVNLLRGLQQRMGLTMLFISHDLAVVEYLCDRVVVLYLGRVVEMAPTASLYRSPRHPYTQALLAAVPVPDPAVPSRAAMLKGDMPSAANPPSGCALRTRCRFALPACATAVPALRQVAPGHWKACIRDDLPDWER
jgi:peptide/nickel transport system ATP-binding protein